MFGIYQTRRVSLTASARAGAVPYTLQVATTKDEIEACYDIRVEGQAQSLDMTKSLLMARPRQSLLSSR